jgi:phospholipase/carboxylesterase
MDRVFQNIAIDPDRVAMAGFSDGATYALALGLANGGVFSRVAALTPGFLPAIEPAGTPRVFVAHGRADKVFPIDRCGRRFATLLRGRGHEVTLREFDGHEITDTVAREAVAWAIAGRPGVHRRCPHEPSPVVAAKSQRAVSKLRRTRPQEA